MLPDHAADPLTRDLLAFIEAAPTPYHAVSEVAGRLATAGFRQVSERDSWQLCPGDRAFVVRGGGSIRTHARQSLAASVTGGGTITYWGGPSVASSINGGGTVRPATR